MKAVIKKVNVDQDVNNLKINEVFIHMAKLNANHPNFPFLSDLDIDQDVKSRLSINLARIYSGNSDILMTPIASHNDIDRIKSEWDKVFQGNREKMNDTLLDLEESQRAKMGPRSISVPWSERWEGTAGYFETSDIDYSTLDATPQAPRDKGKLRPISLSNANDYLKNSTNSGLPFYVKKGLVKERVLANFNYYLSRKDPCVLFTRTQEQAKTRDVWGYPIADTLNEMMYYRPLLDYQKRLSWRTALLGPDYVSRKLTHIITQAMSVGLQLISVDFSNYDRSIKQGLQRVVNSYYKYLFQEKYHSDLDYICERKSTIGLVTPSGVMSGPHGVPSGSTLTNEDDSIAQYIISRDSGVLDPDLFDIQGDDGVYAVDPDKVVSLFNNFKKYGITINESKSYKSDCYLIYLQNLYHNDYRDRKGVINGIYPTYRALNRILYQERWSNFEEYKIEGSDYYSIRTICILENCKHHPLFEKLVTLVLKYDKYNLRLSRKGLGQYVKMISETSGIEGVLINQYGDNINGIKSFETVKLINRLNKA